MHFSRFKPKRFMPCKLRCAARFAVVPTVPPEGSGFFFQIKWSVYLFFFLLITTILKDLMICRSCIFMRLRRSLFR